MRDFKGTKSKWMTVVNDYGYPTSIRNIENTRKICVFRTNDLEETKANAKVMVASIEMLYALTEIKHILESPELIDAGVLRRIVDDAIDKAN